MSFFEKDKIALTDEDLGQVNGGLQLNFLIGGSGSGATGVTMERRVITGTGAGLTARTLQGGMNGGATPGISAGPKTCTYCNIPLVNGACPTCGWPLLKSFTGGVEI